MKKVHYGWMICVSCTLVLICTMGFSNNVFPVYLPYLEASLLTGTQSSALIALRCLSSIVGMMLVERFYRWFSLRIGLTLTCLITSISLWLYMMSNEVWMYNIAALLSGFGYGLGSMIPIAILIRKWFNKRRSTAIGICSAGSGISMIIFPPIVTQIIETTGITMSFAVQAIFAAVVGIITFFCVRDLPSEMGMTPYGQTGILFKELHVKKNRTVIRDYGKGILLIWMICLLLGGVASTAIGHFSAYFSAQGYPMLMISWGISIFGIALTFGKLLCGILFDRFGGKGAGLLFFFLEALGLTFCCLTDGREYRCMYSGMILTGIGLSASTIGLPVWAEDFSVSGRYENTLQQLQILHAIGGILISLLPGIIYDRTGSYRGAYILMTGMLIVATFLLMLAYNVCIGNIKDCYSESEE